MHPTNPNEKLLRRFYEPLVLLSVLDPTRGAHRPDLITDRGIDEPSKLWRNFLDQLSWLCDFASGGDTVTSIAAQKTIDHVYFWVASNSASRQKARDHLEWLFGCLKPLYTVPSVSTTQVEDEVLVHCIAFGSKRVKTYTTRLLQAIEEARCAMRAKATLDDTLVLSGLQKFENLADDPVLLCKLAYDARRHDFMPILDRRHNGHSSRGVWSDLRHYIGRLGCWTKAVRIVCQVARRFPQRVENAQIQVIEPYGPVNRPNAHHLTDLDGVIERMLPPRQKELVQGLSQALRDVDSVANVEYHFREDYSCVKPRPHAELLVLEHFYSNDFEFVADDRYIGCSKSSCYCCHIYMQLHPGGFTPRPCHGNLWINWAPPIPLPLVDRARRTLPRMQEHHTFQMLQKMLPQIRQDLQEQILSKRPKRAKMLDSTTGMSSVVFFDATEVVLSDRVNGIVLSASAVTDKSILEALDGEAMLRPEGVSRCPDKDIEDHDTDETTDLSRKTGRLSHLDRATELCCEPESSEGEDEDILLFHGRHVV